MYIDIAHRDKCTGCMACVDACNKKAIIITSRGGVLYPQIDTEKCVKCNLCKSVCPAINKPEGSKPEEAKVFATWSNDENIRINAASGGFCTQMGMETIERGGFVATVVMKENKAEYILTNNVDDLLKSSNSKYVQGNPAGIYRQVREKLKNGSEVLFCGLPCYCAGLRNFLKREYNNLTTIELVCSPPPSNDAIEMSLKHCKATNLQQFRKKIEGGMWGEGDYNLVVDENKIVKRKDTIFYKVFASMITARKSCLNCQYAQTSRIADFAAADFHGYRCHESNKGVSLVIANNAKAIEKITMAKGLHTTPESWVKAINSNHRLYNGYDFLRYHPGIIFRKNIAGTKLFEQMCLNNGIFRFLWLPYKAITKMIIKLKYKRVIKIAAKSDNR